MAHGNTAGGTRPAGAPKVGTLQAVRDVADKGVAQTKASYETMSAATTEAASTMQQAHSTAFRGAVACNAKLLEFARINSNAAFDYANRLFAAKSPSELIEMSVAHAREQFEVLSEQSKEFAEFSQKMMLEAAEPLKAGAAKMFQARP